MKKIRKSSIILLFLLVITLSSSLFITQGQACEKRSDRKSKGFQTKAIWKESNGQEYLYVKAPNHFILGILEGKMLSEKILYLKSIFLAQAAVMGMSYD